MSDGEELAMLDELAERQAKREGVASPRQGEPRFTISHYEGDPTEGIIAFDNDPELRGCIEIGDERRAEALCRALAAHLGREVGPRGWRATGYELANERGEQEAFIWVEPDGWHSPFSDCVIPGDVGVDVVASAVEALSRDTATEPEP